jgi:putative FmdB family regulatory protein
MPMYEYRCRQCDQVFEARRSMDDADRPLACPVGHTGAVRLLSVFAATGRAGAGSSMASSPGPSFGGGGCGSACGCH